MIRLSDSILVLHLGNVESSFKQKKIHGLQLLGVFEDTYNVGYFSAIKLSRSVQLLLICQLNSNRKSCIKSPHQELKWFWLLRDFRVDSHRKHNQI